MPLKGLKKGGYILVSYREKKAPGLLEEKVEYEGVIVDKRVGWDNRESYVELDDCLRLNSQGEIVAREGKKRLFDAFIDECEEIEKGERPLCAELAAAEGATKPTSSDDTASTAANMMMGMAAMMPGMEAMMSNMAAMSGTLSQPCGTGGLMPTMGMAPMGMMPMGMMPMGGMPMGMTAMPMMGMMPMQTGMTPMGLMPMQMMGGMGMGSVSTAGTSDPVATAASVSANVDANSLATHTTTHSAGSRGRSRSRNR